jgi:O-antigen/teichoic acid export membrane protein
LLTTKLLGAESYGSYKFLQNVFYFLGGALAFGVPATVGYKLTQINDDVQRRELFGASLVLFGGIAFVFTLLIFGYSYFFGVSTGEDLGRITRVLILLIFFTPFQLYFENAYQGDNAVWRLFVLRVVPPVLFLSVLALQMKQGTLPLLNVLGFQLLFTAAVYLFCIVSSRARFSRFGEGIGNLLKVNRGYGVPIYIGYLTAVSSQSLIAIIIGYLIDVRSLGFFSLAITVSMPLVLIPNAVATAFYRDFASYDTIPARLSRGTYLISFATLAVFLACLPFLITRLYPQEFSPVISFALPIAAGTIIHGLGDFYNKYLSARGHGTVLRNNAIAVGILNIATFFILTPFIGIWGAVISKVITDGIYFFLMYRQYKLKTAARG